MANERLRALLLERRVTTAKLAEAVLEHGPSEGIGDTMPAKVRSAITMFRLIESVPNVQIRLTARNRRW